MFTHVLKDLWLNSHLRLLERSNLFQQCPSKLLLHVWNCREHRCESNKVEENLVECLCEVLLISTIQDLPVLPKDFTENLFCDILILQVVLRIYSDDLCQRLHQVF